MIEKVRVSLWDIFTFFLTGLLAALAASALLISYGLIDFSEVTKNISKIPSAISIVAAPLVFTLLGMLLEPPSNYLDKYVLSRILFWASAPKEKHSAEEEILRKEICDRYLGSLIGKVSNPYQICKEYVETRQLSTTFMVFLSRYGFYRNCAFISVATGVTAMLLSSTICTGAIALASGLMVAGIFKRRAEDFYSYLAPAIYRAFLIDKLDWVPKATEREQLKPEA